MADEAKLSDECREIVAAEPQVSPIRVDTRSHFVTDRTFENKEALVEWARDIALPLRFSIVITRSDNGKGSRKLFIVLSCERGGTYKPTGKKVKFEETGTRKCECPFRLRGYFHATGE
jgi:hypothetical protein